MTPKWRLGIQFSVPQYSKTASQQRKRVATTTARTAALKNTKRTVLREALPLWALQPPLWQRTVWKPPSPPGAGGRDAQRSAGANPQQGAAPAGPARRVRSDPRRGLGDDPPPAGLRSVPRGRPPPARLPAGAAAVPAGRRRPPRGSGAAPPRGGGCGEAAPHTPHAAAAAASAVRPASPGCGGGWRFRSEPCPGGSMWPVRAGGVGGGGDEVRAEATAERSPRSPSSSPALPAAQRGADGGSPAGRRAPRRRRERRTKSPRPPRSVWGAGPGRGGARGRLPAPPPPTPPPGPPAVPSPLPLPARLRRRHLPRRGEGARGPRDGGGGWSGRRWCPPLPPALCVRGSARCALA